MRVSHLVYDGSVVGVRVARATFLFDMDVETFNSSNFPQVLTELEIKPGITQLIEHGDIIASQEEIKSGVYAQDVSGDLYHVNLIASNNPGVDVPYMDFIKVRKALEHSYDGKEVAAAEISRKALDVCKFFQHKTGKLLIQFSKEVQSAAKVRNEGVLNLLLEGTKFSPFKEEWLYPAQQDGLFGILAVQK